MGFEPATIGSSPVFPTNFDEKMTDYYFKDLKDIFDMYLLDHRLNEMNYAYYLSYEFFGDIYDIIYEEIDILEIIGVPIFYGHSYINNVMGDFVFDEEEILEN